MQGRTGRIVVAYRLGTLGSVNSLLCGVKRCENDYQPFSLSFQIRTVEPKGSIGSNPRPGTPKERKNGIPNGIPFSLEVQAGFEPADNGVADRGLTTWLRHQIVDCFNIISNLFAFVKCFFSFILCFLLFFAIKIQVC